MIITSYRLTVKKKIPYRNRSPYGWWIASYVVRFEGIEEDRSNDKRLCLSWENTIILRASSRDQAYAKVKSLARRNYSNVWRLYGTPPQKGRWILEGLTSLLPIYEKLADGAEVLYREHRRSVKSVKKNVKRRRELESFQDT